MLESTIEKHVTKYAKSLGWLSYKFSSPSNAGVMDRLYIKDGAVVFVEFKQKGKKPRPLQQYHINKFIEHGCVVYVVDSISYGKEVFDQL